MLDLSGTPHPDSDPQFASFTQPPLRAGHLSVEYDPRPTAVREARAEVRRQLEKWGLTDREDLVDVAELLVSELATNALLHSASRFRLTLSAAHGVLRCEVHDTGRRTPQVLDAGASESGRGVFLVNALARRWGCHQDGPGKTVWFELGLCAVCG
ncbi:MULTISPECIES: ATP-binding protein [unclassified Streptomyces]|uniref:ATP-binding protein n=1 Tax=unclassified Streptomyces TaxID=2593676 RepID=UPI00225BB5D5|nr:MULTISPECIES: ATP-binding protein [unclassified Streptomyces]MCX4883287.1 ATP-binding protein [Streptomyces sp. NBC_00847]MCX5423309.1 ATP-binding protein [Streptomyces sp. NBC_00078]